MPSFEVFPDRTGQWHFRLIADDGETVATSQTYATPSAARRAIRRLQQLAPAAGLRMVLAPQEPK